LGLGSNYYTANQSTRNSAMIFPKQIYARLHPFSESQAIQVGRFTFFAGGETAPRNPTLATLKRDRISQRLIGVFGWSDVGRSLDGIHYADTLGSVDFTLVAATPTRGVFQTDGWGWNRTASPIVITLAIGAGAGTPPMRDFSFSNTTIGGTFSKLTTVPLRCAGRHRKHCHHHLRRAQRGQGLNGDLNELR
jgi:hypothetical protein